MRTMPTAMPCGTARRLLHDTSMPFDLRDLHILLESDLQVSVRDMVPGELHDDGLCEPPAALNGSKSSGPLCRRCLRRRSSGFRLHAFVGFRKVKPHRVLPVRNLELVS